MALDDHYATLRVAPDSDPDAIRSAYRALMRHYHPDVNASHGAVAKAKAINEAYACLGNPAKRANYDRARAAEGAPPSPRWPPPPPPPDMSWAMADPGGWRRPRLGRPTWWQALGFGGATIATAITFTATSATPSNNPPTITYVRLVDPTPAKPVEPRPRDRGAPTTE